MTASDAAIRAAAELLEVMAVGDEGEQRDTTVGRLVLFARTAAYVGDIALAALRGAADRSAGLNGDSPPFGREAEVAAAVRLLGITLPTGRPWTPPHREGTSTVMTVKRACNGCGELIGNVTEEELACAVSGQPLPDVRELCGCVSREMAAWPELAG